MNWTLLEEPYLGKVVCPFNPVESTLDSSKYQMALDVGDFVVVIERHGSGWFRGIDVLTRKVGIFPCSVIKRYEFLGFSSLKGGIDVREKLLNEIAPILFLWSQKVKTSIMNREYEKFSRILDLTKEIKELKELLISEKHNKDAILRLIELIKEGNRLLELPIVANESEDVEKIFTEYNSINPLIYLWTRRDELFEFQIV
ncbi:hypothetical protein ROZALSC1DRAFT_23388 [Rozella allomycis CSF55]|uniref:SH3 domain-containing protein n=1 Tax=Rozella allomycis (strain CSF55) TaxID=988480 RepID=A0A4P9YGZ2_ROZAC|nr:hypothetical protein ROZALSC1DRAFT_23388 [Rozella allomycis CSF55]